VFTSTAAGTQHKKEGGKLKPEEKEADDSPGDRSPHDLRFHAELPEEERVDVRVFFNLLGDRLALSMPCLGFDS
jgi:hypothetical protein